MINVTVTENSDGCYIVRIDVQGDIWDWYGKQLMIKRERASQLMNTYNLMADNRRPIICYYTPQMLKIVKKFERFKNVTITR